jgi:hypothetical protein
VTGPTWLVDAIAALMTVTALYCASRIVLARWHGRASEPDVDLVHVAMGGGMAYLLLRTPGSQLSRLGVISFAVAAAYFLLRSLREYSRESHQLRSGAHHFQHVVGSGAMLVMFLPVSRSSMPSMPAMPSMPGMAATSGHGGVASLPVAAAVLAVLLLGFALANLGRVASGTPASTRLLAPRLALCCQAVTSLAMGYMLLTL